MGFRSFTFTIFAVINVIVSIPVSAKYGVIGCACVTALVLFIANGLVLNIYYVKAIGLDVLGLYRKIFPLLIPIILTSVLTWEVGAILWPDYSWATFVVKCLVFIAVYFCTLFIKGFDSYERSLLSNVTTKVLILFRKQSS